MENTEEEILEESFLDEREENVEESEEIIEEETELEDEKSEESYVEVPTEEEHEDITFGDIAFIVFIIVMFCSVFAFVARVINKNLKNVNLKVGKVELGVESKDNSKKEEK